MENIINAVLGGRHDQMVNVIRHLWGMLAISQRLAFLRRSMAEGLLDKSTASSLIAAVESDVQSMASVIEDKYEVMSKHGRHWWETENEASEDFVERCDAVHAAYQHATKSQPSGGTTKVAVFCRDENGDPGIFVCEVGEGKEDQERHAEAIRLATEEGRTGSMNVFDVIPTASWPDGE